MEESIALNIVILPDEQTRNKAIELSKRLSTELSTEFVLDKDKIPHISIYHGRYSTENLQKLKKIIMKIASGIRPFEIEANEFAVDFSNPYYIWWKCVKDDQLIKTAMMIVQKANPLREGFIPGRLGKYQETSDEQYNIKNYGYLFVGKKYSPHIAITKLRNYRDNKKALEILGKEEARFRIDSIAIGALGNHGTVTGIIESFPLRS